MSRWRDPLIALLVLVLGGCSGPKVTPPAPPAALRTPVQVTTMPAPKTAAKKSEAKDGKLPGEVPPPSDQELEGYGEALKKVPATRRQPPKGEKVYPIDLNLRNADLVETVRVLADTMGLNYSIDPRVKGTANVRASGKLTQTELLNIMETILNINSAVLVRGQEVYKILPMEKASTQAVPVYSRGAIPPGMRAQVVFLEQTVAKDMMGVLKPLMSPAGAISESAHNSLVLVDTPESLDKLLQLIHLVDTRALSATHIRIAKVQNTDPNEVIKELEVIFSAYGTLAQKGKFGVSFLPIPRLNSIMVLASAPPLMERALYWVKQLDMKTDMLANVHIYSVENYKAKNLADLLTQVYGGAPSGAKMKEAKPETGVGGGIGGGMGGGMGGGLGGGGLGGGGLGGGGLGGGGLGGSSMGGGLGGGTMGGGLGGGAGGLGSRTGTGGAGLGGEAGAPLKERATPMGGAGAGAAPKEGVRIIPDEENNLLVVVAPPYEWNIISRLLKQLDVMPRQVMNEVLIAEVTLTNDLKYGVEWLLGQAPAAATGGTGGTGGTGSTSSGNFPLLSGLTLLAPASAAFSGLGGLTFAATDKAGNFKGVINLLAAEGKVNILASPQIMAANNQEARIMIGSDVPILTSQSVPLVSQTTSFQTNTVQYRSTGIILSVKPQINAKGLVTLEIAQEVSDVQNTTSTVSGTPTFTVRQAKTSLITADNQTVVLGGLIREDRSVSNSGVPGLRKLPLLGPLFGVESATKNKTELLVLITPHIVTNMEEGARVTREMKDKVGLEERSALPQLLPDPAGQAPPRRP